VGRVGTASSSILASESSPLATRGPRVSVPVTATAAAGPRTQRAAAGRGQAHSELTVRRAEYHGLVHTRALLAAPASAPPQHTGPVSKPPGPCDTMLVIIIPINVAGQIYLLIRQHSIGCAAVTIQRMTAWVEERDINCVEICNRLLRERSGAMHSLALLQRMTPILNGSLGQRHGCPSQLIASSLFRPPINTAPIQVR
jgi:hypothetical protein